MSFNTDQKARRRSGPLLCIALYLGLASGLAGPLLADEAGLVSIDLPSDSEVFARQGAAVITQADFDAYLSRLPEEHRGGFLLSNERIGQVLQNLILVRLLAAEGIDDGLHEDEVVRANLFQAAMVYLAEEYRHRFLDERMLDDYTDAARELYLTQPGQFRRPETVSFTHVLVWRGRGRGELEAMETIFSIYEALQEGADFDELVMEHSDDPRLDDTRGRYEEIDPEELDENLARAVVLMQPGQISEPVLSEYGWHIVRVDDKHEGRTPEWEEIADQARQVARERHRNETLDRLYRRLLNADPIEVTPNAVEALLARHGVRGEESPTTEAVVDHARDEKQ